MKVVKINKDLKQPEAEPELSPIAQKFYDGIQAEYAIDDASGLALLRRAATIHSDIIEIEEILKVEGKTVISRLGDLKSHPLMSDLTKARSNFITAVKSLSLDFAPTGAIGRPAGKRVY